MKRILIVEDSEHSRELLRMVLESQGMLSSKPAVAMKPWEEFKNNFLI